MDLCRPPIAVGVLHVGRVANCSGKCLAKFPSFSAVSAPIFASKYAFFSMFLDLQDCLAEFSKIWQNFGKISHILQKL